ncbi:lysine--tRNA ligase, partial [archaeon]|nr:lysine--tRNA ligase [archaeon]
MTNNNKNNDSKNNKEEKTFMHWADSFALKIEERVKQDPQLQLIVKKKGYFVYDEKTPSGKIHIGAGRGWIIHDAVAKALRDRGLNAKFTLSSDDMDPFDKVPNYLDFEKYKQYLGVPFRNIPSPVKGYESYATYYFSLCTDKFKEFGIECDLASTGQDYIDGKFNNTIKIALDNAKKIQEIYARFSRKGSIGTERFPFNPICDKCGKIATTLVTAWDSKKEIITYKCTEDLVSWAKGCGHEGKKSPYNGGGKFPWKVEWAAKWPTQGVIMETAGKDHFSKGGSRSVAIAIADEVFDYPAPYPSTRTEPGDAYEFFTIGGKKMSTSKGRGISFDEMTNYAPANM